jgi:hypothetical protein
MSARPDQCRDGQDRLHEEHAAVEAKCFRHNVSSSPATRKAQVRLKSCTRSPRNSREAAFGICFLD